MKKQKPLKLTREIRGRLLIEMDRYLEDCRPPPEAEGKKGNAGRLPTTAGFCRFLGCGQEELERLSRKDPVLYDRIRTVLEDELLNFAPSPTLLNAYMKQRLGYGEAAERGTAEASCGQMKLIFEHNIEEDGA